MMNTYISHTERFIVLGSLFVLMLAGITGELVGQWKGTDVGFLDGYEFAWLVMWAGLSIAAFLKKNRFDDKVWKVVLFLYCWLFLTGMAGELIGRWTGADLGSLVGSSALYKFAGFVILTGFAIALLGSLTYILLLFLGYFTPEFPGFWPWHGIELGITLITALTINSAKLDAVTPLLHQDALLALWVGCLGGLVVGWITRFNIVVVKNG